MHEAEKLSLEQIQAFLDARQAIRFEGESRQQIYRWIEQGLGRQEYHQQSRQVRGWLRPYLAKMTGLSRAQITGWIARYRKSGSLQPAGIASRNATPAPISNCWPKSMRPMRTWVVPPRAGFSSGNTASTASPSMSG